MMSKVYFGPVFDKIPWATQSFPQNYDPFQMWDLSIPSERAPSKLSENHKIVEFGYQNSSYVPCFCL